MHVKRNENYHCYSELRRRPFDPRRALVPTSVSIYIPWSWPALKKAAYVIHLGQRSSTETTACVVTYSNGVISDVLYGPYYHDTQRDPSDQVDVNFVENNKCRFRMNWNPGSWLDHAHWSMLIVVITTGLWVRGNCFLLFEFRQI